MKGKREGRRREKLYHGEGDQCVCMRVWYSCLDIRNVHGEGSVVI